MAVKKITFLTLIYLSAITSSWGYIQEITLYDNVDLTGNSYTMQTHVPDTGFIGGVVRSFCLTGFWAAHTESNYGGTTINFHGRNSSLYCLNDIGDLDLKSFRFRGASDTDVEGISIYPEPAYRGQEVFTQDSLLTPLNGKSILYSGRSSWTLYEYQNFTGKRCCVSTSQDYAELGVDGEFNVGSALKLPT